MAKIIGLTNLSGTINGLVYYMCNGIQMVRKAPTPHRGPKTKGMKNAELRSREFGNAAKAGKYLRKALELECLLLADRHIHRRVAALMMSLKVCDDSPVGSRTSAGGLATTEGKARCADFTFHTHKARYPRLSRAVSAGSDIQLHITPYRKTPGNLIALQINLETGDFRRHEMILPESIQKKPVIIKKKWRLKKGYTDLVFISGENFLQGVVIEAALLK